MHWRTAAEAQGGSGALCLPVCWASFIGGFAASHVISVIYGARETGFKELVQQELWAGTQTCQLSAQLRLACAVTRWASRWGPIYKCTEVPSRIFEVPRSPQWGPLQITQGACQHLGKPGPWSPSSLVENNSPFLAPLVHLVCLDR